MNIKTLIVAMLCIVLLFVGVGYYTNAKIMDVVKASYGATDISAIKSCNDLIKKSLEQHNHVLTLSGSLAVILGIFAVKAKDTKVKRRRKKYGR